MARSRAGLKKVTKSVQGKRGTVRRSYWVKAQDAAKSAVEKGTEAVKNVTDKGGDQPPQT